jgi:cytochrome b561
MGVLLASTTNVDFTTQEYGIHYSSWALISAEQHDTMLLAHKAGFFALAGLITVHILAALKHHFIDKDNVLRRMLPFAKIPNQ